MIILHYVMRIIAVVNEQFAITTILTYTHIKDITVPSVIQELENFYNCNDVLLLLPLDTSQHTPIFRVSDRCEQSEKDGR